MNRLKTLALAAALSTILTTAVPAQASIHAIIAAYNAPRYGYRPITHLPPTYTYPWYTAPMYDYPSPAPYPYYMHPSFDSPWGTLHY